jgi:5-oxoprolinase (ATP-hydrolysing)
MGGTSTDVAAYDGDYERADETSVAGVRLRTPIMDVHTVAAGGGSICNVEAGRLAVGPESAGANPGPACYGKGGPATLTDCNVLLGKIQPRHFPAVFGPSGDQPLNPEASRKRLRSLREEVGSQKSLEALAEDFLRIGVRHMANAIKRISVERGRDPENFVLNCFGGAGPQHACLVAEALGMERVLIHPLAGVLSAAGLGLADGRSLRQKSLETELGPEAVALIEQEVNELWRQAVASSGQPAEQVLREVNVQLRYAGTDTLLSVPFNSLSAMQQQFESRHREMFGFVFEDRALVVGSVVVEAVQPGEESLPPVAKPSATPAHEPVELFSGGRWHRVPVLPRESVAEAMEGPLLLTEPLSTQVVEPGWKVQPTNTGALELVRQEHRTRAHAEKEADPALLEIFNSAFMGVAEQMGAVLQKTARSVNIKERRDFSCALFDRHGDLVANAPHVPVHLGSMSDSVRSVMGRFEGEMKKSDAYIINDPYNGGTHLPDITVVSPVFIGEAPPSFYLASRGHHADVGGVSPGSMPAFSKSILEEGVRFSGQRLVSKGEFLHEAIREQLTAQPHPARNPDQNLADLQAQVAANERGLQALQALIDEFGLPVVQAYTKHVQRNAAHQVKQALAAFVEGEFEKTMDSGLQIKLRLRREQSRLVFDFSGSSSIDKSNYNAPESITRAVVLYALRSLVQERIPLNEGCLKAVRLSIPAASFLSPEHPAAVVAGNVETSQVLADTVFGALGALAGSQATMNNLTFGNERHQYYDTLCGGTGAGPDHPGASGVHSHMTNSVLTDPEILELRYPVRLEHFRLRRGSGGNGRFQGGEGVERLIRFLEPMTLSLLTNSRQVAPHGLGGGQAGEPGENWLLKSNGTKEELPYAAQQKVEPGDALLIKTPGGGGYGQPSS